MNCRPITAKQKATCSTQTEITKWHSQDNHSQWTRTVHISSTYLVLNDRWSIFLASHPCDPQAAESVDRNTSTLSACLRPTACKRMTNKLQFPRKGAECGANGAFRSLVRLQRCDCCYAIQKCWTFLVLYQFDCIVSSGYITQPLIIILNPKNVSTLRAFAGCLRFQDDSSVFTLNSRGLGTAKSCRWNEKYLNLERSLSMRS